MGDAHPAVVAARSLLTALEAHAAALGAAVKTRNIEALRAALTRAGELGLAGMTCGCVGVGGEGLGWQEGSGKRV